MERRFRFSQRKHWHHVGMFINDKSTALRYEQSFAAKTDNNVFGINSCALEMDVETSTDWSFRNPAANGLLLCLLYRRRPLKLDANQSLNIKNSPFSIGWESMAALSAPTEHSASDIDLVSHNSNTGGIKTFFVVPTSTGGLQGRKRHWNSLRKAKAFCVVRL